MGETVTVLNVLDRRIHSRGCTRRPPHGLHGHLPRELRKKVDDIHDAREAAAGHPLERDGIRLHLAQRVQILLLRHNSARVALRRRVSHQLRHFLRLIIGRHVAVRDPASAIIREAFLLLVEALQPVPQRFLADGSLEEPVKDLIEGFFFPAVRR